MRYFAGFSLPFLAASLVLAAGCAEDATPATGAGDADAAESADGAADTAGDVPAAIPVSDAGGGLPAGDLKIGTPTELFDPLGMHVVQVTLDPADWQKYLAGAAGPDSHKTYDYYKASVTFDGIPYTNLAIKGFGNGSQLENPKKPNIRIKFDHFDPNLTGPEKEHAFRLKASGQDPTFLREPISSSLVRSLGGHAPRFSWATVKVNGEDYGPYQLQESVDKRMYSHDFGNNDGNSYQTLIACVGLDCAPGKCDVLKSTYVGEPGIATGTADGHELAEIGQAIATSTPETLPAVLAEKLGLDGFLSDYAVEAVLSDLDGLAAAGQNFTFYIDEKSAKLHIVRTGSDLTFGNLGNAFYDLSAPWGLPNSWCPKRADQLYLKIANSPPLKQQLDAKFRALQCGIFKNTTLVPITQQYQAALKPWIYKDPKGLYNGKDNELDAAYLKLRNYVEKRQKTLLDRLGPCP